MTTRFGKTARARASFLQEPRPGSHAVIDFGRRAPLLPIRRSAAEFAACGSGASDAGEQPFDKRPLHARFTEEPAPAPIRRLRMGMFPRFTYLPAYALFAPPACATSPLPA